MLTDYQAEVRARWPDCHLEGNGPFAVVVSCYRNSGVWLFATELEARSLLYRLNVEGCGHSYCAKKHRIQKIELPTPVEIETELGWE